MATPFRPTIFAPTLLIVAAFLAVYTIWGSTYLAIQFAIQSMPPFLMAGSRWIAAGSVLYAYRRLRGDAAPEARHWLPAAIVGGLLIAGGNGTVSFAQQYVPSGLTALLIAIVPVFIALLEWLGPRRIRPQRQVLVGIALGVLGVLLLVGPHALLALGGRGTMGLVGVLLILLAAFSWANGSLYSRGAPRPANMLLAASMQMLCGGALLMVAGLASGEAARLDLATVETESWLGFAFLVLLGSLVGYSAYVWLLQVVRAELVATYAFVNPIVAVVLGTLIAGEEFTARTAVVAAIIVIAVALVVTAPKPRPEAAKAPQPSTAAGPGGAGK